MKRLRFLATSGIAALALAVASGVVTTRAEDAPQPLQQQPGNPYIASLSDVSASLPGFGNYIGWQLPQTAIIELVNDGRSAFVPGLPGNTLTSIARGRTHYVTFHNAPCPPSSTKYDDGACVTTVRALSTDTRITKTELVPVQVASSNMIDYSLNVSVAYTDLPSRSPIEVQISGLEGIITATITPATTTGNYALTQALSLKEGGQYALKVGIDPKVKEYRVDNNSSEIAVTVPVAVTATAAEWDYFAQTALPNEFGTTSTKLSKWSVPVRIKESGMTSAERSALEERLFTPARRFGVEISFVQSGQNVDLYVVPKAEFGNYFPGSNIPLEALGVCGYGGNSDSLTKATIVVDRDFSRIEYPEVERLSALLEETFQCLGLPGDSLKYPESITYQNSNRVTTLSPWDLKNLEILYSPLVKSGMTLDQAKKLVRIESA